jgi:hypothetical protein
MSVVTPSIWLMGITRLWGTTLGTGNGSLSNARPSIAVWIMLL